MKIGQEMEFKNDFMIEAILSKTTLQVKKGDKGLITRNGIKVLNGEAKGKIIGNQDYKITKGYDYQNIAKIILNRLIDVYELGDFIEDNDLDISEMIDEIEYVLTDIL